MPLSLNFTFSCSVAKLFWLQSKAYSSTCVLDPMSSGLFKNFLLYLTPFSCIIIFCFFLDYSHKNINVTTIFKSTHLAQELFQLQPHLSPPLYSKIHQKSCFYLLFHFSFLNPAPHFSLLCFSQPDSHMTPLKLSLSLSTMTLILSKPMAKSQTSFSSNFQEGMTSSIISLSLIFYRRSHSSNFHPTSLATSLLFGLLPYIWA